MKKLLYASLMAVAMLFAMPTIVRADEGEGEGGSETTTPVTIPTPTFTPASGTLSQGDKIKFEIPTDYKDAMVFVFYVFNDAEATLEATVGDIYEGFEDMFASFPFRVALNTMGAAGYSDGDEAEEESWMLPCVVPSNVTGEVTFRARMATFVGEEGAGDPTIIYSDIVTATYTVAGEVETETVPAPTFNPEAGEVAFGTTVKIGANLDELESGMVQYMAYRVIDNADFDFSQYADDEEAETAGASYTDTYKIVKNTTITAATLKRSQDGYAWSETVSAAYTVTAPDAPTITPAAGAVTAGTKVKITSSHNPTFGAAIVDIYYTTDGTTPSKESTKGTYNSSKEVEVEITEGMTIKAIAVGVADNMLESEVAEATYTIKEEGTDPEAITFTIAPEPTSEGLDAGTEITVTCSDADLDIYYQMFATKDAADAATTLEDGEWTWITGTFVPVLTPSKPVLKVFAIDEATEEIFADSVVVYTVNAVAPAAFSVSADGENYEMDDDTVVFTSIAATFKMALTLNTGDDRQYMIFDTLFQNGEYVADRTYSADETVAEFSPLTAGAYKVTFTVKILNTETYEYTTYKDTAIYCKMVEPEYVDPEFTVTALGENKMEEGTVVFDGMASFTMQLTSEIAAGDMGTNYQVTVTLYTKAGYEAEEKESITTNWYDMDEEGGAYAAFGDSYDGEYVVTFLLKRKSTGAEITDTTVFFNVTNYEEPVLPVDPELTVVASGKHAMKDDTIVFNVAAFTMQIAGELAKGDTLSNYTLTIERYTQAAYDAWDAADSIYVYGADTINGKAIEFAGLEEGEYVARFFLTRINGMMPEELEAQEIFFQITNEPIDETAIEAGELAGVNVYPNPSNGSFNVAVPEKARIDIFGLNGAKVMSREANAGVESFSINHSGIYFVRVMAGNKTAVKRVVVL